MYLDMLAKSIREGKTDIDMIYSPSVRAAISKYDLKSKGDNISELTVKQIAEKIDRPLKATIHLLQLHSKYRIGFKGRPIQMYYKKQVLNELLK